MGSRRRLPLFLIIVAFLLFLTNPTEDDYVNRIFSGSGESGGEIETFVTNNIGKPALKAITTRQSYLFFSVFRTNFLLEEHVMIGFAKVIFIPI